MTDKPKIGSELDLLMSLDPLELSDQDTDAIILYLRRTRLEFELGVKSPKKDMAVSFDMSAVLSALAPAAAAPSKVKRRI